MKTKTPKLSRFVIVALLGSLLSSLVAAGCNSEDTAVPEEGEGKTRFKNDPGMKDRPEAANSAQPAGKAAQPAGKSAK